MSVYLHDIPLPEAKDRFKAALRKANLWRILKIETILLDEHTVGRVLAEAVWAKVSSPHYHASAMDGFAVRSENTIGAQPSTPIQLIVTNDKLKISDGIATYVDTGDPLPEWADAVIPIENIESLDNQGEISDNIRAPIQIRIRAAVTPWSHVRPLGEDIVATQLIVPAGQVLRPIDIGAIAAAGHTEIKVACPPRVAILPTGSELVPVGGDLKPGDIPEYNSIMLAAQVESWGGVATRLPITADDFEMICTRVQEATNKYDLILLNAGSSAGLDDFSARVVEKLGTLLVHGVAVRPGHPVILGLVSIKDSENRFRETPLEGSIPNTEVPIIGVPGYPVSAALTAEIFVEPLIAKWLGRKEIELPTLEARLTRKVVSPGGDDDFIRVAVGRVKDNLLAAPLARGAGIITSLVKADGVIILQRGVQGVEAGESVRVHMYRPLSEIERTIFCIGSHDLSLDLLAQFLSKKNRRLVSANVGSQGGLLSLKRGEAHCAGSHLLDVSTGSYNITSVKQYLSGVPVKLYAFVGRVQGLIVQKGNPKHIHNLEDLCKPGVHFINRQRGAGTRVLLDFHLIAKRISPNTVSGYNQEEYTHLGVAASVASGRADCGLGIAAAAQALNLDFIPLFQEQYDLVIPKIYAESKLLIPLFDVIASQRFRKAVKRMPGYEVSHMGELIKEM